MARSGGVTIRNAFPKLQVVKLPATLLTLALFTATGVSAQLSDSVFKQSANGTRIMIGTTALASFDGGISIGANTTTQGIDAISIGTGSSAREGASISIGHLASCPNSGLGVPNKNIAIGDSAISGSAFSGLGTVAIGEQASARGQLGIAIGSGASDAATIGSIALGCGATATMNSEFKVGSVTHPILMVTVATNGAAVPVLHRSAGTGGWGIRNAANGATIFLVDEDVVAGNSRLLLWDVTAAALKRVKIGAAGTGPGGVGQALFI